MKMSFSKVFFLGSFFMPLITAAPTLILDTNLSPPASIPVDADRIYSVSLGHIISKAVVAYLEDGSGNVIEDTAGLTFNITSLDALDTNPDTFATGGANLCQYGNRREYPNNFEGRNYGFYCDEGNPSMVVSGIPVHEGVLRADGLYHLASALPPNNRKFMLTMEYNGVLLSVTTNQVEVTTPAAQLVITTQPSISSANTDFNIVAEIQDKDGNKITTGIDATLPVMLQVATFEDMQLFYGKAPLNDMVFKTMERLSGTDAKMSLSSKSIYIDKRAVAGEVTFSGVRLLDVHTCARLNLTMRMPNYPHSRMPNTYNDLTMNKIVYDYHANDPSQSLIVYHLNGTSDGAVAVSTCIDVTEQTATALELVTPATDIKSKIGANFVIEDKIVLRAVDAAGAQVYSGQDSSLTVSTTADVAVCLSTDMLAFNLSDGVATVMGSICEPNPAVTLTFAATSAISTSALTTVNVGPIEVTNEIYLASYYFNIDSGSSSQTGTFSDSFALYCVEDINAGRYPTMLPGRTLKIHSYNTQNSAQATTKALTGMIEHGRRNPHEKVAGIVGFGSNTVTKGVAPLLAVSQIPNIATNEDESSFSDKTTYPYYSRLSWNMASTCHSIMMAFKNRGWTTMSIVRTVDFSIANIFYEKAKEFGIKIAVEVAIPNLFGATYSPGAFSTYLQKVKDAGTRIGWMFVFPPVSYYFLREAIERQKKKVSFHVQSTLKARKNHQQKTCEIELKGFR